MKSTSLSIASGMDMVSPVVTTRGDFKVITAFAQQKFEMKDSAQLNRISMYMAEVGGSSSGSCWMYLLYTK